MTKSFAVRSGEPLRARLVIPCLLALTCLVGCGLSSRERNQLAQHQESAALYYGAGKYQDALRQVEKGLAIDRDNYKLHLVAGHTYLRQAELRPDGPQLLRLANSWFTLAGEMRDEDEHDQRYFFGHGRTQLLLGREAISRAERLRRDAESEGRTEEERAANRARARELEENIAPRHLAEAESAFLELVDRTELLRFAHFYLAQLYIARKGLLASLDRTPEAEASVEKTYDDKIEFHASACVQRIVALRRRNTKRLERLDLPPAEEQQLRDDNATLDEMEATVRTTLAALHFENDEYRQSIEQLDLLLTLRPRQSEAYFNRARAFEELGDEARARENYERFLAYTRLPQSNEQVQKALSYITERTAGR